MMGSRGCPTHHGRPMPTPPAIRPQRLSIHAAPRWLLAGGLALLLAGCGQAAAAERRTGGEWAAPTPAPATAAAAAPTVERAAPRATLPPADVTLGGEGEADAGATITLTVGEAGAPAGLPIELRFVEVQEDSRCPENARCVWAGRAVVRVEARAAGGAPALISLGLPGLTDDAPASHTVAGQVISVEELTPYPTAGQDTPAGAYRLTLRLRPASP